MWFRNKKQQREEERLSLLDKNDNQRELILAVSSMVKLLRNKFEMLAVEVEAIKLRFKKKIPYDKESGQSVTETEKPKDSYTGMFIPEDDGGKGIKQGL
jgi:hypothetical protein